MTAYVAFVLTALALLTLRGSADTATYVAICLAAFASVLDLTYLIRRRGRACLVLAHRRKLDTIVRVQWLAVLVGGIAVSQGLAAAGLAPFVDASDAVKAPIVALVIGVTTIYASSLVDWYWVLPRISGIVAPPPCTTLVAKSHAGVTKVWFLHRAIATTVITFLIAGTPAYIAGTITDSASARTALTLLGAAAAIGFNAATAGTVWAFRQFLSPVVEVGNYIRRRKDIDEPGPQDGYVVDVSVQGIKVKLDSDVSGEFIKDGDLIAYHEADGVKKSNRATPMCPSLAECRAVNWYCLRNRNAYGPLDPTRRDPAPLPPEAVSVSRLERDIHARVETDFARGLSDESHRDPRDVDQTVDPCADVPEMPSSSSEDFTATGEAVSGRAAVRQDAGAALHDMLSAAQRRIDVAVSRPELWVRRWGVTLREAADRGVRVRLLVTDREHPASVDTAEAGASWLRASSILNHPAIAVRAHAVEVLDLVCADDGVLLRLGGEWQTGHRVSAVQIRREPGSIAAFERIVEQFERQWAVSRPVSAADERASWAQIQHEARRLMSTGSPRELEALAASIFRSAPGLDPLAEATPDVGADVVVWNDGNGRAASKLGNPLFVQVKHSTRPIDASSVRRVAEHGRRLGLGSVVLFSNAPLTTGARQMAVRLRRDLGVTVLVMTVEDVLQASGGDEALSTVLESAGAEPEA